MEPCCDNIHGRIHTPKLYLNNYNILNVGLENKQTIANICTILFLVQNPVNDFRSKKSVRLASCQRGTPFY